MTESGKEKPTRAKKRKRVEISSWQKPTYDDVKKAKIRSRYGLRKMKDIATSCGFDSLHDASYTIRKMIRIAEMCYFDQLEAAQPRSSQVTASLGERHGVVALAVKLLRSTDSISRREVEYQHAAVKEAQRQGSTSLDNIWSDDIPLEEEGSLDDNDKVAKVYPGRPIGPGRKADWSETPMGRMRSAGGGLINRFVSEFEYLEYLIRLAIEAQSAPAKGRPSDLGKVKRAIRSILRVYERLPGRRVNLSENPEGKLYGPFVTLVNVVLRPVLSSYWDHKSLDNTIEKVVKEHRKRMERISARFVGKSE
jgi:hypothetical protein